MCVCLAVFGLDIRLPFGFGLTCCCAKSTLGLVYLIRSLSPSLKPRLLSPCREPSAYAQRRHCELYIQVNLRHVFLGKIPTCSWKIKMHRSSQESGRRSHNAIKGPSAKYFSGVSGLVFGTDSTHSRGSVLLVRSPGPSVCFPGLIVLDPFGLFGFAYSVSP